MCSILSHHFAVFSRNCDALRKQGFFMSRTQRASTNHAPMKQERDFKGVFIPRAIYLNNILSWTEKILLVEIDSLSKNDEGCFASDKHLSEHLQVSEKTVSNILSQFKKDGLISSAYDHKNGRKISVDLTALKTLSTSRKKELLNSRKKEVGTSQKREVAVPENGKSTSQKREVSINMYSNTDKNTVEEYSNLPPKATKEERKLAFEKSLIPYLEKYDKETLRAFADYWTESNENGKKMRFEMQRIFDRGRRLATWHSRSKDFKPKPKNSEQPSRGNFTIPQHYATAR